MTTTTTDDVTHLRALLAEQTARAERAEAEAEVLLWNLGGCGTYAQGYALDQEPAPERARPALLEVLDLARRYQSRREDYEGACLLVARMHAAAVGEVCGPAIGVVEDVAALKAKCDRALAACAELRAALECAVDDLDGCLHGYDDNGRMDRQDEAGAEETLSGLRILLSRPDLGAGVVVVPREMVERVRDETLQSIATIMVFINDSPLIDRLRVIVADLDALLKKGGV